VKRSALQCTRSSKKARLKCVRYMDGYAYVIDIKTVDVPKVV